MSKRIPDSAKWVLRYQTYDKRTKLVRHRDTGTLEIIPAEKFRSGEWEAKR